MPDTIPFLSLKNVHEPLQSDLHEAALRVVSSGIYINGPETASLAAELAESLGLGNVVPVSNGLDALRLIIRGYIETGRLHPGDEIIIPSNTYIASLLPAMEFGLVPVLVKPDLSTFGLDWALAESLVTPRTKALMTVHLYGTPSWDFEVAGRLRERGILLIEDNAQAIGAAVTEPGSGRKIHTGALGDAAAFSFYPTKNVGALGDAGAVATSDPQLASAVKALANYGSSVRYRNDFAGYNCRMDEIQAAFLRLKLSHLDSFTVGRRHRAELYDRLITNPEVMKPEILPNVVQVWHQYVIRSSSRNDLAEFLQSHGIATDIHYPLSLFDQPCVRKATTPLEERGDTAEASRKLAGEILSLPVADVSDNQIEYIADVINSYGKE